MTSLECKRSMGQFEGVARDKLGMMMDSKFESGLG